MGSAQVEWKELTLIPKPLIQIRRPKAEERNLTILMCFLCKDGVVLASDLQLSRAGRGGSLSIVKSVDISNTGAVAYTTNELAWAVRFTDILKESKAKTDLGRLREAEKRYSAEIMKRYPRQYPSEVDIEGMLATYENEEARIFRFGLHKPPHELSGHTRLVLGEPVAVATAETYLRMVEYVTLKIFPPPLPLWTNYRPELVAKITDIVLTALPSHVQSVNGASIYIIDSKGVGPWKIEDKLGDLDSKVSEALSEFIEYVGPMNLFRAAIEMGDSHDLVQLARESPTLAKLLSAAFADLNSKEPSQR